jgi:hypothetical protein
MATARIYNPESPPPRAARRASPRRRADHRASAALDQDKRALQDDFLRGRFAAIAASNALGMGIDKSDLRYVVHVDMPGSITAYYQEVGRAGRDGQPARGILLFDPDDRRIHEHFADAAQPELRDFAAVLAAVADADPPGNRVDALDRHTGSTTRDESVSSSLGACASRSVLPGFCLVWGKRWRLGEQGEKGDPRQNAQIRGIAADLLAGGRSGEGRNESTLLSLIRRKPRITGS